MTYSYFPGCTLKNKALELDVCARKSAEMLGFTLEEIPEWECCGGVYPLAKDEIATKLASVRALVAARDKGQDLVTLCSACYNVLKQVNRDMAEDENFAFKVNNYLKLEEPYHGETKVLHYLEVLRDVIGFDNVKKAVVRPLTKKNIGSYYGCLLLRPSQVMKFDDPENPVIMENFLKALGANAVVYSLRNECCGAYSILENEKIAQKKREAIVHDASTHGVASLITACPLCQYNLKKNSEKVPVLYFSQLLAYALGLTELEGF